MDEPIEVIDLCSDEEDDKVVATEIPEETEIDTSSWVKNQFMSLQKEKKREKKYQWLKSTEFSSDFNILCIEDAVYFKEQRMTKFVLLVENINDRKTYRVRVTNQQMKIYAPQLLIEFYEKRIALTK